MTDHRLPGSGGPAIAIATLLDRIRSAGKRPLVVGIDLTGSERRPSGICVLDGSDAHLSLVSSDNEITRLAEAAGPTIISIDSPLGLPAGRCCVEDTCECRKYGIMRECERILRKRGIRVYPTLIRSMQQLTLRGIRLSRTFRDAGHPVIESYPGAAQDILRIPRKKASPGQLEAGLRGMGVILQPDREPVTHDHLDALTSALVGYFYLAGLYEAIGNEREGYLILPGLTGREIREDG